MKRLFLIFVATFALGVVVAVVLRARQHQPYAPASAQVAP
jgi:hypothetical protein